MCIYVRPDVLRVDFAWLSAVIASLFPQSSVRFLPTNFVLFAFCFEFFIIIFIHLLVNSVADGIPPVLSRPLTSSSFHRPLFRPRFLFSPLLSPPLLPFVCPVPSPSVLLLHRREFIIMARFVSADAATHKNVTPAHTHTLHTHTRDI